MEQINVGVIGTGWCGGIRSRASAESALVGDLHIAEINPERLEEVSAECRVASATTDYHTLLAREDVAAVMISATPEHTHYAIARDSLDAGKHVLLEKPMSLTLSEADELVELAKRKNVKFTIGYSQRFNPKYAFVYQSLKEGTIGRAVSAIVSRHITRSLGDRISSRILLSPAAMEATHDIDFVLWCMEPARPIRVYAQSGYGVMKEKNGLADTVSIIVTLDSGVVFTVSAGWTMPPGYPNYSGTWIEIVGTDGMLIVDDTHRDVILNTLERGIELPMSSMPGEFVGHVFAGPMYNETLHFLEAVAYDRPVMVTPEQARQAMEVYMAADLSVATGEAVSLPMTTAQIAQAAPV
ncbi:MAG: Gfo/Idh/MocA family oxidoreductase [Chloroflexi bacterium]|nr:Gfo/Idh/MocA family oxidoreductase [Chloroflexota bacterium]